MKGKEKCRILKDIRRRIAEENDIDLVIEECEYQGECKGTCPRCDSELCYLEEQLVRRQKIAKGAAGIALSAVMLVSNTACVDILPGAEPTDEGNDEFEEEIIEMGEVPALVDDYEEEVPEGEPSEYYTEE